MPNPAPAPSRPGPRALPSNFDDLVREALAGGNITKLRSALDATPSDPPPPAQPPPASTPAPRGSAAVARAPRPAPSSPAPTPLRPSVPLRSVPLRPRAPAADSLPDALQALVESARAAVHAQQRGGDLHQALDAVSAAVESARRLAPTVAVSKATPAPLPPSLTLPPPPAPLPSVAPEVVPLGRPAVELPRYRHRWMLILAGPGNAELGPRLAAALGVDGVTARLAAIARAPRVALRSDEPETLRTAAVRVQRLGVSAVVVAREELYDITAPDVVLGVAKPGRLSVSASTCWDGDRPLVPPADLRSLPWGGLSLAVPGEVVVRRYRLGRSLARGRRQDRVLRLATERRVRVLDLHGPGRFLRLIAGLTDTTGLPGHDPDSALRAHKALVERLSELLVKCRIAGDRSCAPGSAPPMPEGHDGSSPIEASGWPLWEEHSRLARVLAGLGTDDVGGDRA